MAISCDTAPIEIHAETPVEYLEAHRAALAEAEDQLQELTDAIRQAGITPAEELTQQRLETYLRVEDLRATLPGVEQAAKHWRHQQIRSAAQEQWASLATKRHRLYEDLEEAVERVNAVFADIRALQAAYSGRKLPLIPVEGCHRFQSNPATDSS